jgi:hypothetical protein
MTSCPDHGSSTVERASSHRAPVWRRSSGQALYVKILAWSWPARSMPWMRPPSTSACLVFPGRHFAPLSGTGISRLRTTVGVRSSRRFFVMRTKCNLRARKLYSHAFERNTGIICDQTVLHHVKSRYRCWFIHRNANHVTRSSMDESIPMTQNEFSDGSEARRHLSRHDDDAISIAHSPDQLNLFES